jgi:hypothetical protein
LGTPNCDDQTFARMLRTIGATETSRQLGVTERYVYKRRREIEGRLGIIIAAPATAERIGERKHPQRAVLNIKNGTVLVGSDGHYWPGVASTAHRAFVKLIAMLKPAAVIMNGDAFDGASISRHPPIGWEDNPSVKQEIEAVQDRLSEIGGAAGKARKIWPLGNHDARFETRLATVAPEYAKVHGVHLADHFPNWEPCWSCWINDDVVVKHRYKGGIHATHNNTLNAGTTIVTGHLHSLKVTPFTDYKGDRWGVDTGTLADPYGPQFRDYTEDSPRNHRSGFVVLTFVDGRLLWPEVVSVVDENRVSFRGQLIEVGSCEKKRSTHARATRGGRAASLTTKHRKTGSRKTRSMGRGKIPAR